MGVRNATIGQIAREAGCSPSTVSRVISGYSKGFSVRPELEAKILSLAQELNYRPNPYWRSLRTSKTRLIAIFDLLVCGDGVVQNAKREFVLKMREFEYVDAGKFVDPDIPDSFSLTFPVDGALLFDIADRVCLNFVEEKKIPYVVVNGRCRENGTAIVADEEADVRKLVDYLYSLGHRRIAYYAGHKQVISTDVHYSVPAREVHYLENIERLGLVQASAHWNRAISPHEFLRKAFHEEQMTAVVCYDHVKAVKLMHAAWELGIRIPEDLSVCCFNDEYPLELLTPPVTCIATPGREMGRIAAEVLLEVLEGKRKNCGETIPVQGELVIRQSVRRLN
jgi:LacI family transcriptional regulator